MAQFSNDVAHVATERNDGNVWMANTTEWKGVSVKELGEACGEIPLFFQSQDPRPFKEQVNKHYAHGGGWLPMDGFKLDAGNLHLTHTTDDGLFKYVPIAWSLFPDRNTVVVVYQHSLVALAELHPHFIRRASSFEGRSDAIRSLEVARLD